MRQRLLLSEFQLANEKAFNTAETKKVEAVAHLLEASKLSEAALKTTLSEKEGMLKVYASQIRTMQEKEKARNKKE
jgi:hypothetical protein